MTKRRYRWGWEPTKKVARMIPNLHGGIALDLGAGCGGNALLLAQNGFSVTVLEKNPEAIKCLKRRIKEEKLSEAVKVIEEDMGGFSFPDATYDLILALNSLHFLPSDLAAPVLRRIKSATKLGGTVFIRIFSRKESERVDKFLPSKAALQKEFLDWKVWECEERQTHDNHPPLGRHEHWVIDLIAQKQ